MMPHLSAIVSLIALLAVSSATAAEPVADGAMRVRTTVELTDGSRLIGTSADESLHLKLEFDRLEIPFSQIRRWDAVTPINKPGNEKDSARKVAVQMVNGDRLTGILEQPQLQLNTILGPVSPTTKLIRSVSYTAWRDGNMPPGEGDVSFGGLNWLTWRTEFAVDGDRLKSLPKPRQGFQYGHEGHGRGPMLFANIGDDAWRDYSVDVRFCAVGIDPAFNQYGLGADYHDVAIMFHVTDVKESQNERGSSFYILGLHGNGSWDLRAVYNHYCDQPMGWGTPKGDGDRMIAQGNDIVLDQKNGNRIRIDVQGEQIQIWFDDKSLVDVVDSQMTKEIAGQRLDHGGIGFGGGFEGMFWIKDVSIRALGVKLNAAKAH